MLFSWPLLAKFVKEFGDTVLVFLENAIFDSPIVQLVVYMAAILMLLSLARSVAQGRINSYFITFFMAWLIAMPINGKPFFYRVVTSLSTFASNDLQRITYEMFTDVGSTNTMPPDFVLNSILRASQLTIDDDDVRSDLAFILDHCIPYGENKDGQSITGADVLSGKIVDEGESSRIIFNFDPSLLEKKVFQINGMSTNCLALVTSTVFRMRENLKAQEPSKTTHLKYSSYSNEDAQDYKYLEDWSNNKSSLARKVENVALNLAHANAVQAAVLKDFHDIELNYEGGSLGPDENYSPETAVIKNNFGWGNMSEVAKGLIPRMYLHIQQVPKAISRSFNLDGRLKMTKIMVELNEKRMSLPFYLAFIQTILKLFAPFIALTGFFGTFKWIISWSSIWFLSLIAPSILLIQRLVTNSVLLHVNKIGETANNLSQGSSFLEIGVNFNDAVLMLEDTSRAMHVFLQCESALWGFLFMAIPGATWLATGRVESRVGKTITSVGTTLLSGGAFAAGSTIGRVAAMKVGGRLGNLKGVATTGSTQPTVSNFASGGQSYSASKSGTQAFQSFGSTPPPQPSKEEENSNKDSFS